MATVKKCTHLKLDHTPCKGNTLPNSTFCWVHDPRYAEARKAGQRRGGKNKSNVARAARQWAAIGREIPDDDLPAMLKAAIIDVKAGRIEPSVASAIANLAKTAVSLRGDLELETRIAALEEAAGTATNVRRFA